jgi:hypothetical protein
MCAYITLILAQLVANFFLYKPYGRQHYETAIPETKNSWMKALAAPSSKVYWRSLLKLAE